MNRDEYMIRSMTGFGSAQMNINNRDFTIELKSVNHRYFEFSSKICKEYVFLENKAKELIHSHVLRGKVDLYIDIEDLNNNAVEVLPNYSLAKGYIDCLNQIKNNYDISGEVSISDVSRYKDIFLLKKSNVDEESLWSDVSLVLKTAIDNFLSSRESEGERLKSDIENRLKNVLIYIKKIDENLDGIIIDYKNRLTLKIKELINDEKFDKQRILTEVAIFADKLAIDEEIVRLKSHLEHFNNLLNLNVAVGRKLDFIVQEMNREVNTIGSKVQNYEISKIVIEIKSEIEKIREQIQNIE